MPGIHGGIDRKPEHVIRKLAQAAIQRAFDNADNHDEFPACLHNELIDDLTGIVHAHDAVIFVSEVVHMYFQKPAVLSATMDQLRENNKLREAYSVIGLTPMLLERIWSELVIDAVISAYSVDKPSPNVKSRQS